MHLTFLFENALGSLAAAVPDGKVHAAQENEGAKSGGDSSDQPSKNKFI
jgi:hypothetical protein